MKNLTYILSVLLLFAVCGFATPESERYPSEGIGTCKEITYIRAWGKVTHVVANDFSFYNCNGGQSGYIDHNGINLTIGRYYEFWLNGSGLYKATHSACP